MAWKCEQGRRRTPVLPSGPVVLCVYGRGMTLTQWGCARSSVLRGSADCPQSKEVKIMFRKEVENVGDCANNGP